MATDVFGAEVGVDLALEFNLDGATHAPDVNTLWAQADKRRIQTTTYARHVKRTVHLTKTDVTTDAVHPRICAHVPDFETSTDAAHL